SRFIALCADADGETTAFWSVLGPDGSGDRTRKRISRPLMSMFNGRVYGILGRASLVSRDNKIAFGTGAGFGCSSQMVQSSLTTMVSKVHEPRVGCPPNSVIVRHAVRGTLICGRASPYPSQGPIAPDQLVQMLWQS